MDLIKEETTHEFWTIQIDLKMLLKKTLETNLIRLFSRTVNQSNAQPSHPRECRRTWTNKKERCLNRSSCNLWILIQLGMDGWIFVCLQLASKVAQLSCLHLMKTRHRTCPPLVPNKKKPPKKEFKSFIKQLEIWEVSFQCWSVLRF